MVNLLYRMRAMALPNSAKTEHVSVKDVIMLVYKVIRNNFQCQLCEVFNH